MACLTIGPKGFISLFSENRGPEGAIARSTKKRGTRLRLRGRVDGGLLVESSLPHPPDLTSLGR